jgi:hypothetical protein
LRDSVEPLAFQVALQAAFQVQHDEQLAGRSEVEAPQPASGDDAVPRRLVHVLAALDGR